MYLSIGCSSLVQPVLTDCLIAPLTNAPVGAEGAHLETGINQFDSRHDVLHAVVDVAVSAGLSGC